MTETQNQIKRQTAYKISIKDILSNEYAKEDGWQPNYIKIMGNKVSRINLIGTVVLRVDEKSIVLDDGSGKITARVFDNNLLFKKIDIGDVILLIGRPREFGSERYILPEIIKKIENPMWINVRKMEMKSNNRQLLNKLNNAEDVIEDNVVNEFNEATSDKLFNLIKKLDNGSGVKIEEILKSMNENDIDKIINKLIENGGIFEIMPGRLKVLE